jgi:hypothetical protein
MSQTTQAQKKSYEPKPITRDRRNKGHYWVSSESHGQLYYKVILTEEEIYCACKAWKFRKEICKHLFKVMALEGSSL